MEAPPTNPMPFSFLELVNRTFRIYRENFLTIIGLAAFVTIPISLLNIIISPQQVNPLSAPTITDTADMSGLLLSLLALIQVVLITAPLTYLVSEYLFGRKISIGEAFSGVSNRLTQIGCGVLVIGFIVALMSVFIMFLVIAFPFALIFTGLLLHIIVATSALMFPVLTLENIGPYAAFSRSWSLGKRRLWAIFGIGIVTVLVSILISSILGSILGTLILSIAPNTNNNFLGLIINLLVDVVSIFVTPISPIAFTLMYYNIRYTTEELSALLNSVPNPANRPINLISPAARFQFDSHDWRNVAILSVIGLVIGIIGNIVIQQFIALYAPGLR